MLYKADLNKLLVVADFDGTLTQSSVDGHKTPSLTNILVSKWYLWDDFGRECDALYRYYRPIEYDHTIDVVHRSMMQQWRIAVKHLMIQHRFHRDHILQIAHSDLIIPRPWLIQCLQLLHKHRVPVIIMSASGVGADAIQEYLLYRHLRWDDTMTILSNQCVRDNQGYMIDFVVPIIHSLNKTGRMIVDHSQYISWKYKRDILLLWDHIHDLQMTDDMPYDRQYAIWRCNPDTHHDLTLYTKYFDHVITNDGPMDDVYARLCHKS